MTLLCTDGTVKQDRCNGSKFCLSPCFASAADSVIRRAIANVGQVVASSESLRLTRCSTTSSSQLGRPLHALVRHFAPRLQSIDAVQTPTQPIAADLERHFAACPSHFAATRQLLRRRRRHFTEKVCACACVCVWCGCVGARARVCVCLSKRTERREGRKRSCVRFQRATPLIMIQFFACCK